MPRASKSRGLTIPFRRTYCIALSIGFVVLIVSNHHYLIIYNDVMQHLAKRTVFATRLQTIIQTETGQFPTFAIGQTMSGQLRDARDQSQPQISLTLKAVPLKPIDASQQRAIILVCVTSNGALHELSRSKLIEFSCFCGGSSSAVGRERTFAKPVDRAYPSLYPTLSCCAMVQLQIWSTDA